MSKTWAAVGFVIGLIGLLIQFSLTIPASLEAGRNIVMALVHFFSYFTILTNLILVLVYAAVVFDTPFLSLFRKPETRVMIAALIALVMIFYHLILAPIWQPEGMWKVADVVLHYVTPLFYLVWFGVLRYSRAVGFTAIPKMLIFPLAYVAYILIRGAIINEYPYAIFEAHVVGYSKVALNSTVMLIAVIVLMAVAIFVDRIAPKIAEAE